MRPLSVRGSAVIRAGSGASAIAWTILARGRPLDGEHRVAVGAVVDVDVELAGLLLEPRQVLGVVGGVGHREIAVRAEVVGEEVVENAAVLAAQHRVLGAARGDLRDVVGQDPLQERLGLGPARLNLAHVADVEHPDGGPDGHMLGLDALVLDGHLPAGEVDQLGSSGNVVVVQRRAPHRGARLPARAAQQSCVTFVG
jgi:hypothetical protein